MQKNLERNQLIDLIFIQDLIPNILKHLSYEYHILFLKYLDSDDIVSLGFEEITLSEYKKGDLYIVLYSDNKILIQNEGETVYYGACKLKNELKKILEWIK